MEIKAVVEKYIQLRDDKAVLAEKHKAEMEPFNQQMEVIEKWLLQEMDRIGADSIKTDAGTPYKSVAKSVKMVDSESFKQFVFADAINHITGIMGQDYEKLVKETLLTDIKWDIVNFQPGKKGIIDYTAETGHLPPGIDMSSFITVNIRRS